VLPEKWLKRRGEGILLLSVHPDLPLLLSGLYAVVSAVAFCVYGVDKVAAGRGRRRVPEAVLHFVALVGGWPGVLAARGVLRHKTRKQPFRAVFWGTVAVNLSVLVWLYLRVA
jgi:uncharacterized membrane protein YsdA (DUF1294 family)